MALKFIIEPQPHRIVLSTFAANNEGKGKRISIDDMGPSTQKKRKLEFMEKAEAYIDKSSFEPSESSKSGSSVADVIIID